MVCGTTIDQEQPIDLATPGSANTIRTYESRYALMKDLDRRRTPLRRLQARESLCCGAGWDEDAEIDEPCTAVVLGVAGLDDPWL